MEAQFVNGADISTTKIKVLKASKEVTRCRDPKDRNVLLQSKRLYTKAELYV